MQLANFSPETEMRLAEATDVSGALTLEFVAYSGLLRILLILIRSAADCQKSG
jgi:hypothetical protein